MNKLSLSPYKNGASGTVSLPGSKSLTNRALLLSSLAHGKSTLRGILESEDTVLMQKALEAMGVAFIKTGTTIEVSARQGNFLRPAKELFLGNSGTSIRFLTALCSLVDGEVTLTGIERMQERPIGELMQALRQLGVQVSSTAKSGFPPLQIIGKGSIKGGVCTMRGNTSSQFISAVLMIASSTEEGMELTIEGDIVSQPYIDMTCSLLMAFGVKVEKLSGHKFFIPRQEVKPVNIEIEADASAASHVFSLAVASKGTITIENFPHKSLQGDAQFLDVLKTFGAEVYEEKNGGTTLSMKGEIKALGKINLELMPDAAMNAVVLAALASGDTRITGLGTLRAKECDRIDVLCSNLKNMGATITAGKDYIEIYGNPQALHGAIIDTANDHRIAMCFAVLGSVVPDVVIENPSCVDKTFPSFWEVFESLR